MRSVSLHAESANYICNFNRNQSNPYSNTYNLVVEKNIILDGEEISPVGNSFKLKFNPKQKYQHHQDFWPIHIRMQQNLEKKLSVVETLIRFMQNQQQQLQ